jgi:UDP-N-acetylmuramyl tripeptide synthase
VILTEEDDRDQDGMKILQEIAAGAEKAGKVQGKDLLLIHKREDAVQKAIDLAKKDDMVLLLGKGEETVIITNKPGFKPTPIWGRPSSCPPSRPAFARPPTS